LIAFRPQARQEKLIWAAGLLDWWQGGGKASRKPPVARLLGYGGAAFGGKTYGILGLAAMCAWAFPGAQMGFIRRTFSEMGGPGGAMTEAHEVFSAAGGQVRDSGKHWYWENGSNFFFRHCEHEFDRFKFQGGQLDILFADEATHLTWTIIDYILTRNRATTDSIIRPFAVLMSNPGNIGHAWYMQMFDLDRDGTGQTGMERWAKREEPLEVYNPNDKKVKVFFIPAYLEDNPIGTDRDPDYERTLQERHPDTYQALRYGNWEVFTGQAFREFQATKDGQPWHVIPPFDLYNDTARKWPKWRAVDKGYDHPYFCLWFTRDPVTGRVYIYRELGGSGYADQEQAQAIATNSPAIEYVRLTFGSPDFWLAKNVGGIIKTGADEYAANGVPLIKGDSTRTLGYNKVHNLLAPGPDGLPRLQIFNTCVMLIDILPKLSKEEGKEDVAKQRGDDPYDTLKLGLTNIDIFKTAREDDKENWRPDEWQRLSQSGVL